MWRLCASSQLEWKWQQGECTYVCIHDKLEPRTCVCSIRLSAIKHRSKVWAWSRLQYLLLPHFFSVRALYNLHMSCCWEKEFCNEMSAGYFIFLPWFSTCCSLLLSSAWLYKTVTSHATMRNSMRSARLDQGPLALSTSVSTDWVRASRTGRSALHCAVLGYDCTLWWEFSVWILMCT